MCAHTCRNGTLAGPDGASEGPCADPVSLGSRLLGTCSGGAQEQWAYEENPTLLLSHPPPATAQVPWTGGAVWGQGWAFDLCHLTPPAL